MTKAELSAIVRDGETSRVAFATADIAPEVLAAEVCGLLNCDGGHVLLGVAGDSSVPGLRLEPEEAREQVMEAVRRHLEPAIVPFWDAVRCQAERVVGVVTLPRHAADRPYKANRDGVWVTLTRVGTTTSDATRLEEGRLYRQSEFGDLAYGVRPVPGATMGDLDRRRLRDDFGAVRRGAAPACAEAEGWYRLLADLDLAVESAGRKAIAANGVILFGRNPRRFVERAGIRAICHAGAEPTGGGRSSELLSGPLVPLRGQDGSVVEGGLVDGAWDFVRRSTAPRARGTGSRVTERPMYPEAVVREAVTNALVHRDYNLAEEGVILKIFEDRLEVQSPRGLPKTMTPAKMRAGFRYARNPGLLRVMRDYGCVKDLGLGARLRMIPGMRRHNGLEPDLIEGDYRFTVCLWRSRRQARCG